LRVRRFLVPDRDWHHNFDGHGRIRRADPVTTEYPKTQHTDVDWNLMRKLFLIILCFFFPFVAVLLDDGLSIKVLWAFLLQLLGHIPGVIYGIYQVTRD
jgi:uncharacterized membrane protein YqaE (UPF0057 family)